MPSYFPILVQSCRSMVAPSNLNCKNILRPLLFSCLFALTISSSLGQMTSKGTTRKTPEERAEEKKRKAAKEAEVAVARKASFAVVEESDTSQPAKDYRSAFEAFRSSLTDLDEVQMRTQLAESMTPQIRADAFSNWAKQLEVANNARQKWLAKGAELVASDQDKYSPILFAMSEMLQKDSGLDRYEAWMPAIKILVDANVTMPNEMTQSAGMVALAHNEHDLIQKTWGVLPVTENTPPIIQLYLKELDVMKEKWSRELAFRKTEAEKNDNPLVELMTSKGKIVLELYEDSAPNTVASFIYLVEKKFYTEKSFFRVESHVCAQTGCERGDGTGDPGYTFDGEANLPNHRDHFRGSLGIALGGNKETGKINDQSGGSQFYIPFLPQAHLDGQYTVFGRVVEGLSNINLFRVVNMADPEQKKESKVQPDFILSAKVIRKRSHDYQPKINSGKLYR
jgi:cyclophilin family peptidyl-prolyl cis-trans isomerase